MTGANPRTFVARVATLAQRARPLMQLAGDYTAAHVSGRIMAVVVSVVLVRLLPLEEYALYTLLLAGFTFITTSSDLGATESLSYFRRRALLRNESWTDYYEAVVRFRETVYSVGLLVSSVYVLYAAGKIARGSSGIILLIAVMGAAAWLAIKASTTVYALKLEMRFREAYAVELSNETAKLVAVALLWATNIATALAGMVCITLGGLTAASVAKALWKRLRGADPRSERRIARSAMRTLLGQIGPVLPGTVYYSLQAPLVACLAAAYGSVGNVAEVGALGRLGALIGIFSGFTSTVFMPRLINVREPSTFLRRYGHWWIVMFLFSGTVMLGVVLFQDALLWILGRNYTGLHAELVVASASATVAVWSAYAWQVNRARGWVQAQPYRVPIVAAGQLCLFFLTDLSSTRGILLFGFGSILVDTVFQVSVNIAGLLSESNT